jgi:hypothetical protein
LGRFVVELNHPGFFAQQRSGAFILARNRKASMMKGILLDEFHLSVIAPRGLPATECDAIRQTITSTRFIARLRRALRQVVGREPALKRAIFRLSR